MRLLHNPLTVLLMSGGANTAWRSVYTDRLSMHRLNEPALPEGAGDPQKAWDPSRAGAKGY